MRWRHRLVLRDKRRERRKSKKNLQIGFTADETDDDKEKSKDKTKSKTHTKTKSKGNFSSRLAMLTKTNTLSKSRTKDDSSKPTDESDLVISLDSGENNKPPMMHAKFSIYPSPYCHNTIMDKTTCSQ